MKYEEKLKKIKDTLYDIELEIPKGMRTPDEFTRGVIIGFKIGYTMGKHEKNGKR